MPGNTEVISLAIFGELTTAADLQAVVFAAAEDSIPIKGTEPLGRSTTFFCARAFADADARLPGTGSVHCGSDEVKEHGEEKKSRRGVNGSCIVSLSGGWLRSIKWTCVVRMIDIRSSSSRGLFRWQQVIDLRADVLLITFIEKWIAEGHLMRPSQSAKTDYYVSYKSSTN